MTDVSVRTNGAATTVGWVAFSHGHDVAAVLRAAADYVEQNDIPIANLQYVFDECGPNLTVWTEDFDPDQLPGIRAATAELLNKYKEKESITNGNI